MSVPSPAPGAFVTSDMFETIVELGRSSQTAHVIFVASVIEDGIGELLLSRMRKLSARKKDRLFDNGPLGSFRNKIELAYALSLIDDDYAHDLHALRDIRNAFAHSRTKLNFHTEEGNALLARFRNYDKGIDPFAMFGVKTNAMIEILNQKICRGTMANVLLCGVEPDAPPE